MKIDKELLKYIIAFVTILFAFYGCTPESQTETTCNCYKRIYFQHLENPIQFLFQEPAQMTECDNWIIGDDTKTDDNGYLYNYLKVCE